MEGELEDTPEPAAFDGDGDDDDDDLPQCSVFDGAGMFDAQWCAYNCIAFSKLCVKTLTTDVGRTR